ncbi:MAG: histidine--tRNA ligase [Bacteroidales bacterium]|nr:histidine--tRNA ligase [Bacteroidales bacterium]
MAQSTASIPKGTRDFSPIEMNKRNYIFDILKSTFKLFGYEQIETPSMENLSTLTGKYGEEGDKLLFKILNSGDFLKGVPNVDLENTNPNIIAAKLCEKGLRYDLTVPFARFVVQHQNVISFPFKRFQIQPVWRADRPQKGRYREFYQCDVDVIGSDGLLNEAELVQIVEMVFNKLNINVVIKINNRKILSGIAEILDETEKIIDITIAIDKLDKIGIDGVCKELEEKGLTTEKIEKLKPILFLSGTTDEKLHQIEQVLSESAIGLKGIEELRVVFNYLKTMNIKIPYELDLTLARGLNYYTGAIFEVKAADAEMGSICGGGRYDNLTGIFGLKDISGVGISFGAERIYDVMETLNLFPTAISGSTKVLFVNFGEKEATWCLPYIAQLRQAGITAEIYPTAGKMKKQLSYADNKKISKVVLVGDDEMNHHQFTVKNMITGEQEKLDFASLKTMLES